MLDDGFGIGQLVAPDGAALPCHSARMLPGLNAPFVQTSSLHDIWYDSDAFNRYRGTAWMSSTCGSCDDHEHDHGGCRCQAYLLTGSAEATDPVCPKSPQHGVVQGIVAQSQPLKFVPNAARKAGLVHRSDQNSQRYIDGELAC